MSIPGIQLIAALVFLAAATAGGAEPPPATDTRAEPVFALVAGDPVTAAQYEAELDLAIREKYFHRRPPEEQLLGLRREVADRLIARVLLLAEAKRRGLQADQGKIAQTIARFEEQNRANPRWQEQRAQLLPKLERELGNSDLLEQLENSARRAPEPQTAQLRQYYEDHRDAFTEPERLRLSIILLKVHPGLAQPEKAKILEQAKGLRERLAAGEDFAALAKEYSGDVTASKGGDMGYLHRGMLGEDVYQQLDALAPGALSAPIALMEGVAILRLDERIPAQLKSFEASLERAAKLWQREAAERQWEQLKTSLRLAAKVEIIDATRYPEIEAPKQ